MIQGVFFVWLGLWVICLFSELWHSRKENKQ